jgi:hypothetical protein
MHVTLPVFFYRQFECKKYFDTNEVDNKRRKKEKKKGRRYKDRE